MKKKYVVKYVVFALLMVFISALYGCEGYSIEVSVNKSIETKDKLKVHFIDVGQGDSILLQNGERFMLIDGGTNSSTNKVLSYLEKTGVKTLDYVIATHPHEDHIGGIDKVIDNYQIETLYMPKVTANTKTFKDVVESMKKKNLKAKAPVAGEEFEFGEAKVTIIAPNNSTYEDINNYSIVLKVVYGENSFLFTGDAESLSEKEILKKGLDIKADVIKLGHHGSRTSSSLAFLKEVNPKYGVITLGKDNDYGHPHKEVMERVNGMNIKIYRTDEKGDIVIVSDGKDITLE